MDEIAQYWLVLKRRWLPAALVFALTTALAAAYTFKQTPIYQAKGQVILKKTNKTSALLSSATMPTGIGDLEGLTGSSPVTTQAEILKSMTTINGVLKELIDTSYTANTPERKRLLKFSKQLKPSCHCSKLLVSKGQTFWKLVSKIPTPS
jgi:polysaccharide biosynthesis transport protein